MIKSSAFNGEYRDQYLKDENILKLFKISAPNLEVFPGFLTCVANGFVTNQ
jgi:hypothetical protein